MCGIVGVTGHRQAAPILLEGLAKLEYRGCGDRQGEGTSPCPRGEDE